MTFSCPSSAAQSNAERFAHLELARREKLAPAASKTFTVRRWPFREPASAAKAPRLADRPYPCLECPTALSRSYRGLA